MNFKHNIHQTFPISSDKYKQTPYIQSTHTIKNLLRNLMLQWKHTALEDKTILL